MYDLVDGMPVKCFTINYRMEDGLPTCDSGSFRKFTVGDKIPYKSEGYNYPENFYLYIYDEEFEEEFIYLIDNGIIVQRVNTSEIKPHRNLKASSFFVCYEGEVIIGTLDKVREYYTSKKEVIQKHSNRAEAMEELKKLEIVYTCTEHYVDCSVGVMLSIGLTEIHKRLCQHLKIRGVQKVQELINLLLFFEEKQETIKFFKEGMENDKTNIL